MTSVEEPAHNGGRIRDAVRTKAEILDVATKEFARAGLAGPGWTRSPPSPAPPSG